MLSIVHTTRCGKFLPAIPTVAYRVGMRTVTPLLAAGLAATLTLTISGCFGDTPSYNPAAEPTTAPLFASDEEALAAAEEAYRDYTSVVDSIFIDGGKDSERILEVATSAVAEIQDEGFQTASEKGLRSTGGTTIDSAVLQQYESTSLDGLAIVTIYVCVDVSAVDILDESGASVVNKNRVDRIPREVTFDSFPSSQSGLIVSNVEVWTGEDFCVL